MRWWLFTIGLSVTLYSLLQFNLRSITVVVIKPDAVERGLEDEIILAIKRDGFSIVKAVIFIWTRELVYEFYNEHVGKPFYKDLEESLLLRRSVGMIIKRRNAVKRWRRLMRGLRMRYALDSTRNSLHGSDSDASVRREFNLLFT